MKPIRAILAGMLAVFFMQPILGNAEDIDIYSGLGTTGNVPNVMIVLDNAANNNANANYTCVMDGTPSALGETLLAVEQCALYYVVKDLPVGADGAALVNVGVMMYNANNMTDVAGLNCAAMSSAGGCLVHPLTPLGKNSAGVDQKPAYLAWIKSWNAPSGPNIIANNANTGATMQETWAYYSGSIGLSGRDYSGIKPASGCQKNFVIFIGNAYNSVGSPNDQTGVQAKLENAPGVTTEQKQQILDTVKTVSCLGPGGTTAFTFPSSNHEQGGYYADEWARYMYQSDLYSATGEPTGRQSITTYSIGVHNPGCKQAYEATLFNMAHYGGGKYFATNDYSSVVQAILKILNEVQAVNSVFSSSSLPVSVNAQGTYLNQVYMGMFRPDPGALPRWAGNLKQYKFIINPASGDLQLGDSIGEPAIDASGTGFLSPNAISYWTCSDPSNPFLTGINQVSGLPNVTAAQLSLLTSQGQICANDPDSGFWANFNSMMNSAGKAFDMADGELVEKGGAAQRIRLDNLTDNYAANPSTPRKLYTYCPSGASCNADLTNAANAFSTSNANITATLFGTDASVNISALSRSGTTVTVTTSGVHGFATNDAITIANASPADYNGTYTIAVTDTNHFTYQIVEYPPLAVSPTGPTNFTAAPTTGGVVKTVSGLVRIGNTARVTSVAHGFPNGTSVVISGASPNEYNGSFTISNVTTNTFDYVLNERPPLVAGGGKVTITYKSTGAGCPCTVAANINAWNAALPGIQRSLGSTTITVNTGTGMVNSPSWVGKTFAITNALDSFGLSVPEYNVSGTIVSVSGNSFTFTLATALTPASPAQLASAGTPITASGVVPKTVTNLTRVGSTAFATVTGHGFADGSSVSIGGTPKPTESGYVGIFNITLIDANNFSYPIVTTPSTPATGVGGVAMTATRSTGFAASDMSSLINWVRGEDSYGDETSLCPPGSTPGVDNCPATRVTVRPSVHGDVLHSRPTVLNYGGLTIDILATSDSGGVRTATASTTDVAKIGTTGATANFKFASGNTCAVTVDSATTFTYSASNCGASGAQTVATDTANVVVYYGDNGGVFHAVNGNQVNPAGSTLPAPGTELWGLILKEHFTKLNRLRTNTPQLNLPSTPPGILPAPKSKDYFVDGLTGVYQLVDAKGATLAAHLYLSMRRGGRMIYAMDVTDPQKPRFLWKVDNTTAKMSELGQTWSTPKVARVAGYSNPVLIFGAGYDTNQDTDPPTAADSMGRGIFVLDAITGALVWKASYDSAASSGSSTWTSTGTTTQAICLSDKLKYSIPSDITLMDRNRDGYIDRLYVADLGGQVWRVDLEPGNTAITPPYNHVTPDYWKLHRLASLGECGTAVCRKFFFPPEVINTTSYDAVILGSGDREHPLYNNTAATGKQNMVFLLKDTYTGNDATGMTRISLALGDLFNATGTAYDGTLSGYYINLADGEKVVNAPSVTAGYVFFGTNQPTAPSTTSCTSSLGTARGYRLSPFTASYQSVIFAGGGLPPSPVSGVVNITTASGETKLVPFLIGGGNPECTGADCASALGGQKPPIAVSTSRIRTYWYKKGK